MRNAFVFILATLQLIRGNDIRCHTTKGEFEIELYPDWSPLGAARFIELVEDGFFTDIAFYRCVDKFLTQFGISDHTDMKHWHRETILDDPNLHKGIRKYYLSYAGGGPNTRSTQLFIAFENLDFLGKSPWETPFGKVVSGQETIDNLYKGYGDIPPFGKGPDQQKIHNRGNAYIRENFPQIDFIHSCSLINDNLVPGRVIASEHHQKDIDEVEERIGKEEVKSVENIKDRDVNEGSEKNAIFLSKEEEEEIPINDVVEEPEEEEVRKEERSVEYLKELQRREETDIPNLLRKNVGESRTLNSSSEDKVYAALTAVVLLVVALLVIGCLHKYRRGHLSPKSL